MLYKNICDGGAYQTTHGKVNLLTRFTSKGRHMAAFFLVKCSLD